MTTEAEQALHEEMQKALGAFVFEFQGLENQMQELMWAIVQRNGLQNFRMFSALLVNLTFENQRTALRAIIDEVWKGLTEDEEALVSNIFNRIRKVAEYRNGLVHSTWASTKLAHDEPLVFVTRRVRQPRWTPKPVSEVVAQTSEAGILTMLVGAFAMTHRGEPLARVFAKGADGQTTFHDAFFVPQE